MEITSDKGQKHDESTKEKGAKDDEDDKESGKDGGTEGADQIKSSCNLNVDGGKDQLGKDSATKGSYEKILVLKLKTAKQMLMDLMNVVM
jgi:hypothetical protein